MINTETIQLTHELQALFSELDEFKVARRALSTIAPKRLKALRKVATVESIGSSTRIEGAKLTDREIERLLGRLEIERFGSRDGSCRLRSRDGNGVSGLGGDSTH